MAELAHIEKNQKLADFWGSKSEENISFHFWKNKKWHHTLLFSRNVNFEILNMKYGISNLIDTNKNNSNYDDDAEEESNSNRNI